MPTELEELVGFLSHGNTQVRQVAAENLVSFSTDASIFKKPQMVPIKDLKLLVSDYKPIAENAFTMLINLSHDDEVLKYLAEDSAFIEVLLRKITDMKDPHGNSIAMLLANLAKSDNLSEKLITQTRALPTGSPAISTSKHVLDQLMDCFVRGAGGKSNPNADFDYLSYFFADISKHKAGRSYFVTRQDYDGVVPITKLTVFTEHSSIVRRKGVASTIKNVAFEVESHAMLLDEDGANLLPYILLPLAGNEEYSDEDTAGMLSDLQLLPPDKERDRDHEILITHLDTLLLLSTKKEGRDLQRQVKVYPIVRECHLHVDNDEVREACDRLVQVLMRDEEGEEKEPPKVEEIDKDNQMEELF